MSLTTPTTTASRLPRLGATGLELTPKTSRETHDVPPGGTKSGNGRSDSGAPTHPTTPSFPELARLVGARPELPPVVRAAIAAMVRAAAPTPQAYFSRRHGQSLSRQVDLHGMGRALELKVLLVGIVR
jgi:hypothetical protein